MLIKQGPKWFESYSTQNLTIEKNYIVARIFTYMQRLTNKIW